MRSHGFSWRDEDKGTDFIIWEDCQVARGTSPEIIAKGNNCNILSLSSFESAKLLPLPRFPLQLTWFYMKYSSITFSSFSVEMGLLKNSITRGIDFGKFYFPINYRFHQRFWLCFTDAGQAVSRG